MSGMDALHVEVRTELSKLRGLLREYLDQFHNKGYRKRFPWVDQIAQVKSVELSDALTTLACAKINAGSTDVWLAVPEIVDWTTNVAFRFSRGPSEFERFDFAIADFIEHMGGEEISPAHLDGERVYAVDANGVVNRDWSVFRCLYAEVDYKGSTYALTAGSWYRIDTTFAATVNADVAGVPVYSKALPFYAHGDESLYCADVAAKSAGDFALMDQKLIAIGGRFSGIEFCDLFSSDGDIVHVKRYGASSVLSHLIAQELVSAEAFRSEPKFREKARGLLTQDFHWTEPIASDKFQVVFAVVSERPGALKLPFFTRVNLRQAVRRLGAFGYKAALAKIVVDDAIAKKKKKSST
jgi:uncharacterized protein (TIGR04141 family)